MRINLNNTEAQKRLIFICDEYKNKHGADISPTQMVIRLIDDAHRGCTYGKEDEVYKDNLHRSSS